MYHGIRPKFCQDRLHCGRVAYIQLDITHGGHFVFQAPVNHGAAAACAVMAAPGQYPHNVMAKLAIDACNKYLQLFIPVLSGLSPLEPGFKV